MFLSVRNALLAWRERVGVVGARHHVRRAVAVLEEVVAFLEIAPERNEFGLIAMRGGQRSEPVIGETCGKNLDREMLLPLAVNQNGEPIEFLDAIVSDGMQPMDLDSTAMSTRCRSVKREEWRAYRAQDCSCFGPSTDVLG